MMRLQQAGLSMLARVLRPALRRLFPDVPVEHRQWFNGVEHRGEHVGLVNAATLWASGHERPGVAKSISRHGDNAMCTFLAINTGSVQLIPITAIAVWRRGSNNPSAIVARLLATTCSSAAGLIA